MSTHCIRTFTIDRLIDWLINWLIDALIDWLIDWSMDWLSEWVIDWLIDQIFSAFCSGTDLRGRPGQRSDDDGRRSNPGPVADVSSSWRKSRPNRADDAGFGSRHRRTAQWPSKGIPEEHPPAHRAGQTTGRWWSSRRGPLPGTHGFFVRYVKKLKFWTLKLREPRILPAFSWQRTDQSNNPSKPSINKSRCTVLFEWLEVIFKPF